MMNILWQVNDSMRGKISDLFRQTAGSLTVVLGLLLATAAAATDLNPRLVSRFQTVDEWAQNGQASSVAVSGTVAYVSTFGRGLQILDISNPAAPTRLGSYLPASGLWLGRVVVTNDYAYFGNSEGLTVLDVSNPATPRRVGGYNTRGWVGDFLFAGDYAYLADGAAGLVVLDVSNPASPRRVGGLGVPGVTSGVVVSGNYAYLTEGTLDSTAVDAPGALRIMDITDPTNPQLVADYAVERQAHSLAMVDGIAYVSTLAPGKGAKLEIIDVSDPTAPKGIGNLVSWGFPVIHGDRAIVGSLEVLDISNPAAPRRVGGYPSGGFYSGSVVVEGNYAYVAAGEEGFQIIDLEPEANLPRVGSLDLGGHALGIAASGNRAYVAEDGVGLQIVDISDSLNPARLGSYEISPAPQFVATSGGHACAVISWIDGNGSWSTVLEVVDVSNPGLPQWMGSYNTSGSTRSLAVSGNHAFLGLGDSSSRIEVVDLSDPTNPRLADIVHRTSSFNFELVASGNHLLATDGTKGLFIYDIGNPSDPRLVGNYEHANSGFFWRVTATGSHAYALTENAGLLVLDLADPTQPKLSGSVTNPIAVWGFMSLAVSGSLVYGTASGSGVQVFDVSDPTNPRYAGGNSAVVANDLAISGNHLFVAGDTQGLQVFDLALSNPEPAPSLSVVRSGSMIEIAWPAAISGAVLEASSALAPTAGWIAETTAPAVVGDQHMVTLEVGGGSMFFRLRMP
jgi:hypothetical protein